MDEADGARQHVVLTGATGFIGRHLQQALLEHGHQVTAIVRPGSARAHSVAAGVTPVVCALDDRAGLDRALAGADLVIYAAGSVRGRHPADFAAANVDGVTATAAAAARSMRRPRLLLVSSLAASRPHLSDYAASKHAGEQALARQAAVSAVVLRPPAVYGPGDVEMRPLLASIRRGLAVIVGPGGQRLSLIYAADLAAAVVAVVEQFDACAGGVFELDDGRPGGYGWDDIVAAARGRLPVVRVRVPRALLRALAWLNLGLSAMLGYAPMLTPGKVRELSEPSWLCNNQRLSAATAWHPQVVLSDGANATFTHETGRAT
ncbi:MAG: NAD-dependent epimerase/dehydratase family protein [Gammaproteobacteria bacterium]